jgi:hypothetical protein
MSLLCVLQFGISSISVMEPRRCEKETDFHYCFACPETMIHPKGEKFIDGHNIIPHVYNGVR